MTPERHQQIGELFEGALNLEPGRRHAFLDQACAGDPGLRREVESLLASHEKVGGFIAAPALEVAAKAFATTSGDSKVTLVSGTHLGPYAILSLIGAGGMGEVYKALDTRLNRAVAIKVLPAHFSENPEMKERFERETKTVAALSHPNILAIFDIGAEQGVHYAVTEFLEGETLRRVIDPGPLPWRKAVEIAMAVAEGLSAAHSKGIIHRDVKPENIFLTADGRVKILDFGLALWTPAASASLETEMPAATAPGLVLGTSGYMSPEQVRGVSASPPSDVFALGCVLYEMVSGRRAFARPSVAETFAAVLTDQPPDLESWVPAELTRVINHCLEKSPQDRFQSARDLAFNLRTIGSGTGIIAPQESIPAIDSLAVLPFTNASGDPDIEYLSDGITESLINRLSQISGLRVVPRSSVFRYKGQDIDPNKAGRQLKVQTLLTGKVLQRGDTLSVQAELVDVKQQAQLWGDRFVRRASDIIAVEDEIARQITEKLRLKLTGEERERMTTRYTEDTEAYHLYLKGRYYWSKRTGPNLKKSIGYFEQAIARDGGYALPYAGLADAYVVLTAFDGGVPTDLLSKAKAAARRALEIDPDLPEAQAELCLIWSCLDRDWDAAEAAFRSAMRRTPAYWLAHDHYAFVLAAQGRFEEALAEVHRGKELEPLSLVVHHHVAWVSLLARRYDDAIAECRSALEMDPTFGMAHRWMGIGLEQQGLYDEAIASLDLAVKLDGGTSMSVAAAAHAYAVSGRIEEARRRLADLQQAAARRYVEPYALALVSAALGAPEQALQWLEQANRDHSLWFAMWANADPRLDVLRHDARFQGLLRRLGLPKRASGHHRELSRGKKDDA